MIVKFMSDQNCADDDPRKDYRIFSNVVDLHFMVRPGHADRAPFKRACMEIAPPGGERYRHGWDVQGNVYVMDDTGTTISSYSPNDIPPGPQELTTQPDLTCPKLWDRV